VANSSVMAARRMDRNSGPILRRLWTNVHLVKSVTEGVIVFCHAFSN